MEIFLVILAALLWSFVGWATTYFVIIRKESVVTLQDFFALILSALLGPVTCLIALLALGNDIVLWKRK